MNESIATNIINVLKSSTDKSVIYKALVKLRTDLVKDRDGIVLFRDCGGIFPVVRFLNRPHEKILEVALSILGNCCTEEECCQQAIQAKIISPLVTILKSIPNPIVQCRACRLLGNLAKENRAKIIINSFAIAQSLCLILEESNEIQTTIMATRAARLLLMEKQFLKDFLKCNGFKILMTILVDKMKNTQSEQITSSEKDTKPVGRKSDQPREKYFEEVARHLEGVRSDIFDVEMLKKDRTKSSEFMIPSDKAVIDLISEILKSIQIISELQSYCSLVEVYSAGFGFTCLVFFADEDNYRSISLRILSNFSKNPGAIAVLSAADAVTTACILLTSGNLSKPLSESEMKHVLNIICMLSGDACNRAKIRRSGALKELVERAKISTSFTEISLILYGLNNFQYDHISMDLLLRGGLVGILIKELDAYLNSNDKHRKEKCEEKQRSSKKRKSECIAEACRKAPKLWADLFEPDSPGPSSPQNPNSKSPSSPCSSRGLSPVNLKQFYDNDINSEVYSPVCSDDEGESTGDEEMQVDENSDVMKLLAICSKTEPSLEENVSDKEDDDEKMQGVTNANGIKIPYTGSSTTSTIDIIDNLLLRISLQLKNRSELSKPETLSTIIQAINVFGVHCNCFGTSLCNILTDSEFFVPIIKQDVIHRVYQMTKIEDFKQGGENFLDTLMSVGESGYGRGELTRLLMKGEPNNQKRAAIAVSFIIRSPKILYQLLTENGALYILINSILDKNDEHRFESADALTCLSQSLGIALPICDLKQFDCEKEFDESLDFPSNVDNDDTMNFILHRGCSKIPIKFNKTLLTQNSEVFNSMLNSDFRECNEKEVHLNDYTVNGIKYFLNLIKLESEGEKPNIPPVYHFDSILEAYELSRMYILESLERKLFTLIVYRLDESSSLKVFEWTLKNFNPELSDIAINYYLCSDLSSSKKVQLFREADMSTYSKEWNQMIIDAVLVKLLT